MPFRGDYLILKPEKSHLVHGNIYPVPDPEFPFLGVHFTPRMDGSIWLGPNAVLAFAREGYHFFTLNRPEFWDALTYPGLLEARHQVLAGRRRRDVSRPRPQRVRQGAAALHPRADARRYLPGPSGVRAQAMTTDGGMVDDFVFEGSEGVVHVRNAPSPAATSSLAIGRYIADEASKRFSLGNPVPA